MARWPWSSESFSTLAPSLRDIYPARDVFPSSSTGKTAVQGFPDHHRGKVKHDEREQGNQPTTGCPAHQPCAQAGSQHHADGRGRGDERSDLAARVIDKGARRGRDPDHEIRRGAGHLERHTHYEGPH